jgi:hypothetical protein
MIFLSVSEQSVVVLLLEGALFSWPLAMDERGGYEDLRGSGRRSVIHTSIGELSCIARACLSVRKSVFDPVKRCLPGSFIGQSQIVTMRPEARQVVPRWLKPYTTFRALRIANDVLHEVSSVESSCLLTLLY